MQAVASTSGGRFGVAVDQQDQQFGRRTGHRVGGRARIWWNPLTSLHLFLTASNHDSLPRIMAELHLHLSKMSCEFLFGSALVWKGIKDERRLWEKSSSITKLTSYQYKTSTIIISLMHSVLLFQALRFISFHNNHQDFVLTHFKTGRKP